MTAQPQPMNPHGVVGRLFGWAMDRTNRTVHQATVALLRHRAPRDLLEIGFGTGQFAVSMARAVPAVQITGVDPSTLMVDTAMARARRAGVEARTDLRLGDDTAIDGKPASLDVVVALHSFQFWAAPEDTLATIRRRLRPGGWLVLVLRDHGSRPLQWLPNPVSRSGDEVAATATLLRAAGFDDVVAKRLGGSPSLVGLRPQP